jgi:hypothetical protein
MSFFWFRKVALVATLLAICVNISVAAPPEAPPEARPVLRPAPTSFPRYEGPLGIVDVLSPKSSFHLSLIP